MKSQPERGECLWIASQDEVLCQRAIQELKNDECTIRRVDVSLLATSAFWQNCEQAPGAIMLDVGEDLDLGTTILRHLRRWRVPSRIIFVGSEFTAQFGTKIVSEGVCYCLIRDFATNELRDVVVSLLNAPPAFRD